MTLFQIVFLVVDGVLLVLCPAAVRLGWVTLRAGVVWAATCLSAGVAVLWPRLTLDLAKLVGIGRGADLLLYCSVVVMMLGFLMTYARIRALRREITLLVRHIAILEGEREQAGT